MLCRGFCSPEDAAHIDDRATAEDAPSAVAVKVATLQDPGFRVGSAAVVAVVATVVAIVVQRSFLAEGRSADELPAAPGLGDEHGVVTDADYAAFSGAKPVADPLSSLVLELPLQRLAVLVDRNLVITLIHDLQRVARGAADDRDDDDREEREIQKTRHEAFLKKYF